MKAESSPVDLSSERSLATLRGGFSILMPASEPSLSKHEVGVDSSGIFSKRLRR